jgi:hypothetical protein
MSLPSDLGWLVGAITARRARPPTRLRDIAISAETGLGIYRHAYRARLVECLADDFPALRALLGPAAFDKLAGAVIAARPPREATLNRYGRQLVIHLRARPQAAATGRLALDLARLEWALVEAIHAPLAPALAADALAGLPPQAWAGLRLAAVPSLRVITSRWPIDLLYRQHLRGETPTVPLPDAECVLVLRRSDGLHRLALVPERGRLVAALARGLPLGEALARSRLAPGDVRDALAAAVAAGCFTSCIAEAAASRLPH